MMRIFICACLFIFYSFKLGASHINGGFITYEHFSGTQYIIKIALFRDCRGISLNGPSYGVYAGNNGANSTGIYSLSCTRLKIKDVTPLCSMSTAPCSPQNIGGTGEGQELHYFEDTVDLSLPPFSTYIKNGIL
jgi:hypothetical protein